MRNPALQKHFLALSDEEKKLFAKACNTTTGQMQQVMYGYRKCGAALAVAIDRETKGQIRCETLCPDVDFAYLRSTSAYSLKAPVILSMQIKIPQMT